MHLRVLNCDGPFLRVVTRLGGELLDVLQFRVVLFGKILQLSLMVGKENVESSS